MRPAAESGHLLDRVRQFWDHRPCNIRHSPKPLGTREYFDEVEARKYFVEPHIPRFALFDRWKGKSDLMLNPLFRWLERCPGWHTLIVAHHRR